MATFQHGKNATFRIGTNGAPTVLTDITSFLDSVTYPRSADVAETTAFGSSARSYMPGFPGNTISISGKYDGTASTGIDAILSALQNYSTPVALEYRPAGSGSGKTSYDMAGGSGNPGLFLTSYQVSSAVGDVVSITAEFTGNLAVTRTQL